MRNESRIFFILFEEILNMLLNFSFHVIWWKNWLIFLQFFQQFIKIILKFHYSLHTYCLCSSLSWNITDVWSIQWSIPWILDSWWLFFSHLWLWNCNLVLKFTKNNHGFSKDIISCISRLDFLVSCLLSRQKLLSFCCVLFDIRKNFLFFWYIIATKQNEI